MDGFRFDLMGLIDTDLMTRIREALDQRYGEGEKLVYGEPWAADSHAARPGTKMCNKGSLKELPLGVGVFSDDIRDAVKGSTMDERSCGFVLWKNDHFWTSRKKELTKKMTADLLKNGRTTVKGMWSEKTGKTYDAAVLLDDTGGKYINFKLEFSKKGR